MRADSATPTVVVVAAFLLALVFAPASSVPPGAVSAQPANKTWAGGVGLWNDTSKWIPNGTLPNDWDDVLITGDSTVIFDMVVIGDTVEIVVASLTIGGGPPGTTSTFLFRPVFLTGFEYTNDFTVRHDVVVNAGGVITDYVPDPPPQTAASQLIGVNFMSNLILNAGALLNMSSPVGPFYQINANLTLAINARFQWTYGMLIVSHVVNNGWIGSLAPALPPRNNAQYMVLQAYIQGAYLPVCQFINTAYGTIAGLNLALESDVAILNYGRITSGVDASGLVAWFNMRWTGGDNPATGLTNFAGSQLIVQPPAGAGVTFVQPAILSAPYVQVLASSALVILYAYNPPGIVLEVGVSVGAPCALSELMGGWTTNLLTIRPRVNSPCSIVFGPQFTLPDGTITVTGPAPGGGYPPNPIALWNGATLGLESLSYVRASADETLLSQPLLTVSVACAVSAILVVGASFEWRSEAPGLPQPVLSRIAIGLTNSVLNVSVSPTGNAVRVGRITTSFDPTAIHSRSTLLSTYGWEVDSSVTLNGPTDIIIPYLTCTPNAAQPGNSGLLDALDSNVYNDSTQDYYSTFSGTLLADVCLHVFQSTPRFVVFGSIYGYTPLPAGYTPFQVGVAINGGGIDIRGVSGYASAGMFYISTLLPAVQISALQLTTTAIVIAPSAGPAQPPTAVVDFHIGADSGWVNTFTPTVTQRFRVASGAFPNVLWSGTAPLWIGPSAQFAFETGVLRFTNLADTAGLQLDTGSSFVLGAYAGANIPSPLLPATLECGWLTAGPNSWIHVTPLAGTNTGSTPDLAATIGSLSLNGNASIEIQLAGPQWVHSPDWTRIYAIDFAVDPNPAPGTLPPALQFTVGWPASGPLPRFFIPFDWETSPLNTITPSSFHLIVQPTGSTDGWYVYGQLAVSPNAGGGAANFLLSAVAPPASGSTGALPPPPSNSSASSTGVGPNGGGASGGSGMSAGAKAGIAIGVIAAAGAVSGLIWYFRCGRGRSEPLLDSSYSHVNN